MILPELPDSIKNRTNDEIIQKSSTSEESRNILIDDIVYLAKKNILPYYKTPMAIKQIFLTSEEWAIKSPNLSNVDNFDFTEQDLSGQNYSKSYLSQIDLSKKNLSNADLSYSNLSNANLSNADLSGANLSSAKLLRAKISNTKLSNTNI